MIKERATDGRRKKALVAGKRRRSVASSRSLFASSRQNCAASSILHAVLVIAGLTWQVAQLPAAAQMVVNRVERVGVPAGVIVRRVRRDGHVWHVTRMHNNGGLSRTREAARGAQYDDDGGHRGGGVVKTGKHDCRPCSLFSLRGQHTGVAAKTEMPRSGFYRAKDAFSGSGATLWSHGAKHEQRALLLACPSL